MWINVFTPAVHLTLSYNQCYGKGGGGGGGVGGGGRFFTFLCPFAAILLSIVMADSTECVYPTVPM